MIIDAFMFNDEFEMLDIRLAVTEGYVDHRVILEGNKTWSGKDKPYHLQNNFEKYAKYQDRITLITLDIPKDYKDWQCENYSRASLQRGIDKFDNEDIVIHSDLDEILDPTKLSSIIEFMNQHNRPVNCQLEMYAYKFDQQMDRNWSGHVVAKKHMFENPQKLYKGSQHKRKDRTHAVIYPDIAGWHWTWIGNDERIKNKVVSCIESQHRDPDQILEAFKRLDTISAINHKCTTRTIATAYPEQVQSVLKHYPQYWNHAPVP
jgi:beta-1,4-mannosyl-glycoprotein beta-1,4-N-acetylglucosaminyltransferase